MRDGRFVLLAPPAAAGSRLAARYQDFGTGIGLILLQFFRERELRNELQKICTVNGKMRRKKRSRGDSDEALEHKRVVYYINSITTGGVFLSEADF